MLCGVHSCNKISISKEIPEISIPVILASLKSLISILKGT